MSVTDVLTAIDHALDDWSVSGDAMRWTPEQVTKPRQQGRAPLSSALLAPLGLAVAQAADMERAQQNVRAMFAVAGRSQEEALAAFVEAVRRAAEGLGPVLDEVRREADRMLAGIGTLNEAWLLPDEGPTEPRARALWIRQTRNTGPSRDLVHQRRPRRLS